VLDADEHPSRRNIERMCSKDFFAKHEYRYIGRSIVDDHDESYEIVPPREGSKVDKGLSSSPVYEEPDNKPNNERLALVNCEDASDYSCAVEMKTDKSGGPKLYSWSWNTTSFPCNTSVDDAGYERRSHQIFQWANSSKKGAAYTNPGRICSSPTYGLRLLGSRRLPQRRHIPENTNYVPKLAVQNSSRRLHNLHTVNDNMYENLQAALRVLNKICLPASKGLCHLLLLPKDKRHV